MSSASLTPETLTIHVPFRVVKRGGRREVQLPEDVARPRRTDSRMVKALARAFRWKRMLEAGECSTISDLARQEGIAPSYVARLLQLTILAPDIIAEILDGRQDRGFTIEALRQSLPYDWAKQRHLVGYSGPTKDQK